MTETARRGGAQMGGVYRLCRMLHGYLSAFAFLALIFFAFTGLTLRHAWFRQEPTEQVRTLTLPPEVLAQARAVADPRAVLGEAVRRRTAVIGLDRGGEVVGDEVQLRFEGPKGTTDVTLSMLTGRAEVAIHRVSLVELMNALHRGHNSGRAWGMVIEGSAWLFLALSIIGYVLFFSLRFRLRTSLILTGVSLAALVTVVAAFVR